MKYIPCEENMIVILTITLIIAKQTNLDFKISFIFPLKNFFSRLRAFF